MAYILCYVSPWLVIALCCKYEIELLATEFVRKFRTDGFATVFLEPVFAPKPFFSEQDLATADASRKPTKYATDSN
jgi:hypothetical protein